MMVLLPMMASAQSDNITFADENVKAICVANWDTNGDGELSYGEAAAVTSLEEKLSINGDLTSFDEFQYFTGVRSIGYGEFFSCYSLTSIVIPSNVINIDGLAFLGCYSLTDITIPSSVLNIENTAFNGCPNLTSITVENGNGMYDSRDDCNAIIEIISNKLIVGCQNTVIPSSVTSIGDNAFKGCSNLTSITIPSSVTSIGVSAFSSCSGLTSVTLPTSLKSIGSSAFYNSGLTGITIPSGVTNISSTAFNHCQNLTSITVDEGNGVYDSRNDCNAIIITSSNELFAGCPTTVIPSSVTSIGADAFSGSSITSVTIPSNITSIGFFAFRDCTNLTTVKSMLEEPFELSSYAFSTLSNTTWQFEFTTATLYVPAGTKEKYEATSAWNLFPSIVEMDATGIGTVQVSDDDDAPVYNLNGQRVNTIGKGIYIKNGKKVLVR